MLKKLFIPIGLFTFVPYLIERDNTNFNTNENVTHNRNTIVRPNDHKS